MVELRVVVSDELAEQLVERARQAVAHDSLHPSAVTLVERAGASSAVACCTMRA